MYQTALLLLTGPVRLVVESIGLYLNTVNKRVVKRLYVKLEPDFSNISSKTDLKSQLSTAVPLVYNKASSICKHLDVRVLLSNIKTSTSDACAVLNIDVILTNSNEEDKLITNYVDSQFNSFSSNVIKLDNSSLTAKDVPEESSELFDTYKTVCLGGTFDRLHNGHKVLLTEAVLRAQKKLIVGVSNFQMIKKKILWELIEPVEKRIEEVSKFLTEVDPSLYYDVVPIADPFGPTITDPDIDCIVVTTETKLGGEKVNIERKKKNMSELKMIVVGLVENSDRSLHEDEKVSSSTNRMHLLGAPLNPPQVSCNKSRPYSILFRGNFLSGKSFVATRFQLLGLPVLCCDEILKAIFNKDEELRKKVAERILNTKESVECLDFVKLVLHCLRNEKDKDWLAELIHSKVKSSLQQVLKVYFDQGARVVLIKDSSILEGYDLEIEVNEIWATILPTTEALKRLKECDNLPDDEVSKIMNFLPANEQYVNKANILFCNMWSTDAIQAQITRAWSYVNSIKDAMLINML